MNDKAALRRKQLEASHTANEEVQCQSAFDRMALAVAQQRRLRAEADCDERRAEKSRASEMEAILQGRLRSPWQRHPKQL